MPEGVPDEAAVFTEPLGAALDIMDQIQIHPGDRLLLIGAGRLGQIIAQALALANPNLKVVARYEGQRQILADKGIACIPENQVEELESQVEAPIERRIPDVAPVDGPIRLGSRVMLRTLGNEGVVTALSEDEAEVQIGVLRIRARLAELVLKGAPLVSEPKYQDTRQIQTQTRRHESPGVELDLRGKRSEDALDTLDSYLELAYLAKLPWVRIIHGKGTGKLRSVVRGVLGDHPHVRSFEGGKREEGGDGVTVAKLRE